jgi:hypothetical protein
MPTQAGQRNKRGNGVLREAPGRIVKTLDATVTEKPSRSEVVFDVALLAAGTLEAISPPAALAGVVVNRLIHVAK